MVWGKVEDFGEERTGGAVETKAEGFGPNRPDRMVLSSHETL
jgi:hypothetical protein